MTAPLTIKDLNCPNCPDHSENKYTDFCGGYPMARDDPTEIIEFIRVHGCALPPLALQVLAGPVIEELENRITLLENARGHNMNLSGGNLSISLYRDMITLLKEGVKNHD